MMTSTKYYETAGFISDSLTSNVKSPGSNAFWSSPSKCGTAPTLAAVSGASRLKANATTGISRGKVSRCPGLAKYKGAIPAVPLRSVPTDDMKQRPEKSVSSNDNEAKKNGNTVDQKEESWKNEENKLAALISEAKEFISLLDADYAKPNTCPTVENFRKDTGESKDQHPSLNSDDFPLHSSIDQSVSRKRLKVSSGISAVVQEENACGTETMLEDEDEVIILSPAEWNVSQLGFNHKDESVKPSIGNLEKTIERKGSLKFDDYIDPVSVATKADQSGGRFPDCMLTEAKCRDLEWNIYAESGECSPKSEGEQYDDEANATFSLNCTNELECFEGNKELINLEFVQHDHPQAIKVMEALKLFKEEYNQILQDQESKPKSTKGPHLVAAERVKARGMNLSFDKPFGHIPGIEIGDEFSFRSQLTIAGLHRQFTPGIDYVTVNGTQCATSVVNSWRYEKMAKEHDILIYSGQGGNPNVSVGGASDQKLERGNLALSNSMKMGFPLRVIHKRKCLVGSETLVVNDKRNYVYVYDGLYKVNRYWQDRENQNCKLVYKFELQRMPGQPRIPSPNVESGKQIPSTKVCDVMQWKEGFEVANGVPGQPSCHDNDVELGKDIQATEQDKDNFEVVDGIPGRQRNHGTDSKWRKKVPTTDICVLDDVSQGLEKFKVRAMNKVDDDHPPPFTYITDIVYPHWYWRSVPAGCDCVNGCSDSVLCPCVKKNGGEIPYTEKGLLMKARTDGIVHECGPSCKCPPTCMNRVSQHGPRIPLEIFKTKSMGWGVRSRDYIMPGRFICEYVGELLNEREAEQRIGKDEYLFDICHGDSQEDDFALDAAKCGNIGRFINHSCDPNVFSQKVFIDHDDKRMPHIMFFASKRIPPRQELMYDYNYSKIHVRDANGNIKRKACHCGARECTGRLY